MKQLFLTSSSSSVTKDLVTHFAGSVKGKKLVFIDTAAEIEEGDKQWLADDRQALVDIGFGVTDYTLTGKNADRLRKDLSSMDVIFVSGGNTFYLLQQAQQSGFDTVVHELVEKQGKTYIGSSAGSVIAAPDISAIRGFDDESVASKLKGYKGFNFVPFLVYPHWGSPHFASSYRKELGQAYKADQIPLVVLTDKQYVWVSGNKVEIINTH